MNTATRLRILEENPILSAYAQAGEAIDRFIVSACDGNASSGKIVTNATGLRKLAELLGKLPRVSAGDYAILANRSTQLRKLIEEDQEAASLSLAPEDSNA